MQKIKTSREEAAAEFWQRMDLLIGDEKPYPWAVKHGLNRSAFQSARERGTKPLSKTVAAWAANIGCSYEWLDTGIGEPFAKHDENLAVDNLDDSNQENNINFELLELSIETLECFLNESRRNMTPNAKSALIITIYKMYSTSKHPEQMREQITQLLKTLIN